MEANSETTALTVCLVMAIVIVDEDPSAFAVELRAAAVMDAAWPGDAVTAARVAAAMAAATEEGGIGALASEFPLPVAPWAKRAAPEQGTMAQMMASRRRCE